MDCRENCVVLVFQASAGPATRRIGWIEGQVGEKPLAGSIALPRIDHDFHVNKIPIVAVTEGRGAQDMVALVLRRRIG